MFHTQPWKPNMHALQIYPAHKCRKTLGQNKTAVVTKVTIPRCSKKKITTIVKKKMHMWSQLNGNVIGTLLTLLL